MGPLPVIKLSKVFDQGRFSLKPLIEPLLFKR